ncbi:YfaP family protein [Cupriavidus sp. 2TAF22]|uniref:YfaP family protein n=1 Tax=unclassified Cupriavidus TaxID=2640874 RepID=UPI003F906DA8
MHRKPNFALARLILPALLLAGAAHADDAIEFTTPRNGWRNSAGDTANYTQEVHYPAVSVSTPAGQAASAMIAGRIRSAPKAQPGGGAEGAAPAARGRGRRGDGSVATLVINGVAMPQRVEEDGRFSRPYAFSAGSNSVEMRSAQGASKRVQFYDGYQGRTRPRLRVVLSWDSDATDLDLHVVAPDGQHTFYANRVAGNGGALDVDVTTGYGPEIYSIAAPPPGTYLVYVNYYGSGAGPEAITVAQVAVITDENTPSEKQQVFRVPMRKPGELTLIKSFVMK